MRPSWLANQLQHCQRSGFSPELFRQLKLKGQEEEDEEENDEAEEETTTTQEVLSQGLLLVFSCLQNSALIAACTQFSAFMCRNG